MTSALGTPTGTVVFTDGTTVLGTAVLTGGQATLTTSTLANGAHPVTVSYGGDATFAPSTSVVVTETVNAANTTTILGAAPNPSTFGSGVTFTATVTSAAGTPTGMVTFLDGTTVIGSGALAGGRASLTTSTLEAGGHSVTAAYGGSIAFGTSTSGPLTETISAASTSTTLSSTPNPSTYGTPVTFTATVASTAGTPGGTVSVRDGTVVIGTGTLANGQAIVSVGTLPAGMHSISASYVATPNYIASTSAAVSQTVTTATTSTALTATPNPSSTGSPVTFTATVSSPSATPAGTVTFTDGATVIGTATLSNGQGVLVTSSLTAGTHSVTASYAATTNFTASTSTAVSESVNTATVLYVDRNNGSCTNTGAAAGTGATPYCTIGAAAAKAFAGVTVVVATGTYGERVSVANSGDVERADHLHACGRRQRDPHRRHQRLPGLGQELDHAPGLQRHLDERTRHFGHERFRHDDRRQPRHPRRTPRERVRSPPASNSPASPNR